MRKLLTVSIFIFAFFAFSFGQNSNCPTISVTGPKNFQPDGEIDFTADVSGIDVSRVGYKWTVSEGVIVQGQGTPEILVSIKGLYDNAIKATVEISNLPEGCPNTESETGIITVNLKSVLVGGMNSSSKVNYDDIDAIINDLKEKSDWKLYLISYPDRKGSEKKANTKLKQITDYLSKKEIAAERIVVIKGSEGKDEIQFWLVPPGTELPTP